MPKVLFLERRVVQDENRNSNNRTVYEANQVYNMDQDSADHWVRRGAATLDEARINQAESGAETEGEEGARNRRRVSRDTVQGSQTQAGQPGGSQGSAPGADSTSGAEVGVAQPETTKAGAQSREQGTSDKTTTTQGTLTSAMSSLDMPGLGPVGNKNR